jgi:hypothetical protein
MLINWLSIAKYGAILAVILGLVGGGFYMKSKIDSVETLKAQVATMAEQQKLYADQVQKWTDLDKRISDLEIKRSTAYATTDKNVPKVIHTPSLTDTHLTAEQLCYWNDNGDATATSACLSKAASSPSTGSNRN